MILPLRLEIDLHMGKDSENTLFLHRISYLLFRSHHKMIRWTCAQGKEWLIMFFLGTLVVLSIFKSTLASFQGRLLKTRLRSLCFGLSTRSQKERPLSKAHKN